MVHSLTDPLIVLYSWGVAMLRTRPSGFLVGKGTWQFPGGGDQDPDDLGPAVTGLRSGGNATSAQFAAWNTDPHFNDFARHRTAAATAVHPAPPISTMIGAAPSSGEQISTIEIRGGVGGAGLFEISDRTVPEVEGPVFGHLANRSFSGVTGSFDSRPFRAVPRIDRKLVAARPARAGRQRRQCVRQYEPVSDQQLQLHELRSRRGLQAPVVSVGGIQCTRNSIPME